MSEDESKPRKSVAFGEATDLINGETKALTDDNSTAENHSVPETAVEDVEAFDPSTMKKKKKKTKEATSETTDETAATNGDLTFDPTAMKKKKKKKEFADGEAPAPEGEFDPSLMKKKKKSKKAGDSDFAAQVEKLTIEDKAEGEEPTPPAEQTPEEFEAQLAAGEGQWAQDSNVKIKYGQLLKRFYVNLYDDHPELSGDGRSKNYKIPPPQVVREGNKKSIFVNLPEIARKMKRHPDHISQFIFAELGTSGSTDGSGRLVIKGRFQQKQLESVLRRYIIEYLTCGTCKSPNTNLIKENRIFFVTCNVCGSRKSVTTIKSGFQATIGKRKKQQG